MINERFDVVVIGGGPAGLAAAVSAKQHGAESVLVLDRNSWLGGILPQCIHDGFGVEETGTSMTGPEYAEIYIQEGKQQEIRFMTETMVLRLEKNLEMIAVNKKDIFNIKAGTIVLATGCREKTRWHALIPGTRPSGIYTAGVAQALINLYNIMPGKNIVILGSGDVGLIMARRLTLEGANVLAVAELLPYASGLPRNIVQCLDDYDIPLFLNHTITCIGGKERVEQVTIQQVDDQWMPIPGTEKQISCDTLLLSLGLIPENELAKGVGIEIDGRTGGPVVNQRFETTRPGVFACGNSLQVYDTVDMLAIDAQRAGGHAAISVVQTQDTTIRKAKPHAVNVIAGVSVRSVVPQQVNEGGIVRFTLRVQRPSSVAVLRVLAGSRELLRKKLPWVNPVNLISVDVLIPDDVIMSGKNIEVIISDH
ncbi:MAG TPA: FAD-dependent oxidoreductase [Candidatus Thermoplasmatota archaeon]|nr:FAD-dependent oxidoreductase [Candidatus Thermoplasmatota archaeon]